MPALFPESVSAATVTACRLGAALGAQVQGMHVSPRYELYPPIALTPIGADIMVFADERTLQARREYAGHLKAAFEAACAAHGMGGAPWSEVQGAIPDAYGTGARMADMAVMMLADARDAALGRDVFEAVLMQSGRPVLALPDAGLSSVPERVVLAWDGSLQAARAATAALPVLALARETLVLTLGEPDPDCPDAAQAAQWLARHGVNAVAVVRPAGEGPTGAALLEAVRAEGGEMLAMGGYSHARLQESLFGGVTRKLLRESAVALLLAH